MRCDKKIFLETDQLPLIIKRGTSLLVNNASSSLSVSLKMIFLFIIQVRATCNDRELVVCYVPHGRPPYITLKASLKAGMGKVYLKSLNKSDVPDCPMIYMNSTQNYCITMDIDKNPCGLLTIFKDVSKGLPY